MAGVFLIETGRRKSSNMEFRPEVEEEGIKFNMENAAEDIINGLDALDVCSTAMSFIECTKSCHSGFRCI